MIQAHSPTLLEAPKQDFKQDIRAYFDRIAPELDRWSRRNRYYYNDLARLHRFIIPPGSRVLEVGCGTGDLLQATEPSIGVGIDFAPAVVAIAAQKYPHLSFYTLDAETLDPGQLAPEHRQFDYIILSGVLGYLG
ncbi:MAG TPA: class I SAM-dependent methyltransferase, partial [Nodosilinea sp.]|nr:class I SAM-dependent methyltransferase [Nodosilinea sp.]